MSTNFVPENFDLRASLRFCFLLKKSAAESHRMLVEAYGDYALSEKTCRNWFQRFKAGEFDLKNEERGRPPKKFEDEELQALLNKDESQTQKELAYQLNVTQETISKRLKAMGKILSPTEPNSSKTEKSISQNESSSKKLHNIKDGMVKKKTKN